MVWVLFRLLYFKKLVFIWGYGRLAMLWFSGGQQRDSSHTYTYIDSPQTPSHPGCRMTLGRVRCAAQQGLLVTHFTQSRVCMSPPHSLTICSPHSYPPAPFTSPQPPSPATAITSSFSKSVSWYRLVYSLSFLFVCFDICFISSGLYYCLGVEFPLSFLVDKELPGTNFRSISDSISPPYGDFILKTRLG